MTVTFLCAIRELDISTLATVAADIEDALAEAGFDVESVKPWARPTVPLSNPFEALPSLVEPQITTENENQ